MWTIRYGDFMIGDAAYRVSNARVVLFSRDPHLAAIGMTWMPLSTLATLPFTLILQPFGLGWAAGTLMSAVFGAGTVLMLARLAGSVRASHTMTVIVVVLYALNPVTIFWMGSGMMEAPALFFLTWACVSWIRWLHSREIACLAMVGVALGCGVLTRYEQLLVTAVFCVLVAVAERTGRRRAAVVMVALPSIAGMGLWLAANLVIKGDALAFLRTTGGEGCDVANAPLPISLRNGAAGINTWCDVDLSFLDGLRYAGARIVRFAPALLLISPFILVRQLRQSPRASSAVAIVSASLAVPLFVGFLISRESGTGNPRYFLASLVGASMICLVAAGWHGRRRWLAMMPVVALLLLGVWTSTRMETSQLYAGMENEERPIGRLIGVAPVLLDGVDSSTPHQRIAQWRTAAELIDRLTDDDDLIAMDSSTTFTVLLFSRHLDRFAIPEDRDFEQLLSLTQTKFTFVVVSGSSNSATGADLRLSDLVRSTAEDQTFEKVADLPGVGELFQLVSDRTPTPDSQDSNL
jgi:hypothetical protein